MIGPVSLTMSFVANHTDGGYDEEGDDDYEEYLVAQLCIFQLALCTDHLSILSRETAMY